MPPKDPLPVVVAIRTLLALAACTQAPAPTVTAEPASAILAQRNASSAGPE